MAPERSRHLGDAKLDREAVMAVVIDDLIKENTKLKRELGELQERLARALHDLAELEKEKKYE